MKNILRQTSFLFIAQVLIKAVSLVYIIYLARALGVENFGLYSVALAYFSIISSIGDFGFSRFLVREIAKDKSKTPELLSNIIVMRLTLTSVLFALSAVVLYLFDPNTIRLGLTLLAVMAIIPQSAAVTFDAVFVGLQRLQYSAIALFISNLLLAFLGFYLVGQGFGPFGAVTALIIGQIIYAVLLLVLLIRNQGLCLSKVKLSILKQALVGSLPYGLLGILGLMYFKIDTILLSYIKGSYETGLYSAAYKFLESIIFIPGSFAVALFPALAKLHDEDRAGMKNLYFKSLKLMGAAGLVLFVVYILVLPEVIRLFLPNYLPAIDAIKVLSIAIPFMFLATPGVQVLFSSEKFLKTVIFLSLFTLAFNVILNLIFIPKYGFLAAAWVTVASEILSFAIFFLLIKIKYLGKVS